LKLGFEHFAAVPARYPAQRKGRAL